MATTSKRSKSAKGNGNGKWVPPIRELHSVRTIHSDDPGFINRLIVGTPTRGVVRMEWHAAMRAMMIPPNWSSVSIHPPYDSCLPVGFTVAHAQNIVCREVVEHDYEWMLFIEDDVCVPVDTLMRLGQYVKEGPPIVSGVYYTKARPSEPLVYRGRGNGSYTDWKPGDKVWADGVPTGLLLVHGSIIKAMWEDARAYEINGQQLREVFVTPLRAWVSPQGDVNAAVGTSDLEWCSKIIEGEYLKKTGWTKYARRKFPFLVDTAIFARHIALDGQVYP